VPTTYGGSEWTAFYGIRDRERRRHGAGGGAQLEAIVYEVGLTLDLPREVTGGTALNALAHCCEALYTRGHEAAGDELALKGAAEIGRSPAARARRRPRRRPRARACSSAPRTRAMALALNGLALAHAMAQAIGGRYGIAHGALNAVCLPAALRFKTTNSSRRASRRTRGRPGRRAQTTRRLPRRCARLGVPEGELPLVADDVVAAAGARANPRPVSRDEAVNLLRETY
jgi:alcohol dehydrogenase class IV